MPTHVRSGIHHILSSVVEAHDCENPNLPFGGPLPWSAKAVRLYARFWRHYMDDKDSVPARDVKNG
jgi:hypothetical protein